MMSYGEQVKTFESMSSYDMVRNKMSEIRDEMIDYCYELRERGRDSNYLSEYKYCHGLSGLDGFYDDVVFDDEYYELDDIDSMIDDVVGWLEYYVREYFFDGLGGYELGNDCINHQIYYKNNYIKRLEYGCGVELAIDYWFDGKFSEFIESIREHYCPICTHLITDWDGEVGECALCGYLISDDDCVGTVDSDLPYTGDEWGDVWYPDMVYGDEPRDNYPWLFSDEMVDKYPKLSELIEWSDGVKCWTPDRGYGVGCLVVDLGGVA